MAEVKFTAPKEFAMPEGVQQGETFDAVCTFRVESNGELCLVKLGESDMPGYADNAQPRPNYSGYAKDVMGGIDGGGA